MLTGRYDSVTFTLHVHRGLTAWTQLVDPHNPVIRALQLNTDFSQGLSAGSIGRDRVETIGVLTQTPPNSF